MNREAIDVGEALEALVHQFADPWSFLRELIQNAIDAGSGEIDVRIDYEPGDDPSEAGLMIVEIVDTGEGMDRQIIDTRLTRLFSSAKDGDYTKIGRFGIGFVSVFAIGPELVCVDTGRNGEFWRVLFKHDRSFERIVLDQAIEGTTIRIYKRCSEAEVDEARTRARATLEYWCKHARVDVRLDDALISGPLAIAGHCVVEAQEEDTRVLLAIVGEREAVRGYYHGGLTLHEEHDDRIPHVAFKIDSRYLEHTLTRDNVIRDANFDKAMMIVARLVRGPLLDELLRSCERFAVERRFDAEAEFLRARVFEVIPGPEVDIFARRLIPTVAGEPVSLAEVRKQIKRCWAAPAASPVTDFLRARGDLVVELPRESALRGLIVAHCQRAPQAVESVCMPTPVILAAARRGAWERLRTTTGELLARLELEVGDIALGHLAYPGSAVADHVAITQASFGELTRIEDIGELSSGWFRSGRVVVLNADHPTVEHLLELSASEPELAAYLLLKLFFLRGVAKQKLDPKFDGRLASLAAEARCQRSIS